MTERRLWPLLLGAGLSFILLLSLGIWQVERLQWKTQVLAAIDARLALPPVALAEATGAPEPDGTIAKVTAKGHFLPLPLRKISVLNGGPGWEILQGFETLEGRKLLVARGVAAEGQATPAPEGEVELVGLLRRHETRKGIFDPDNDPAGNHWYSWDVPAMAKAAFAEAPPEAPDVLHLLPGNPGSEGLHVEPPKADLRNNHLGYAITWFGLAATLLVMTGLFVWQRRKQS